MNPKRLFHKTIERCIPDSLRIRIGKLRRRDIYRDGKWLKRQGAFEKSEYLSDFEQRIQYSNLNKLVVPTQDSHLIEAGTRRILGTYLFDFHSMLIIVNPYELTPLCALLYFSTEKECYVSYCVKGKTEDCHFTYTSDSFSKQHRIPVMGLYGGRRNSVSVTLLDEKHNIFAQRIISISTHTISPRLKNMVTPVIKNKNFAHPFLFVTGGLSGPTYAFDRNGEIRYFLSKSPRQYGIHPISSGRFFFPDRQINRPTYINHHALILHDMDFLGRVRQTCHIRDGIHHWLCEIPDTNGRYFLAASSSLKEEHMEDRILCFDRESGEIIRRYDLGEVFPKKFQKRSDWAHINCLFCEDNNYVIFSLRNISTVAKMDLRTGNLNWILAHPSLYEGTQLESLVLKPTEKDHHYFFQQHAAELIHTFPAQPGIKELMLFDNHCATKQRVPWFDGAEESDLCVYKINENEHSVSTEKVFPLGTLSPTRSNGYFDAKSRHIFSMSGNSSESSSPAVISEWDYDTGEELNRFEIQEGFFKAFPFTVKDPEIERFLPTDFPVKKGTLIGPALCTPPEECSFSSAQILPKDLEFARMDNLLLIRALDHKLEKVYLCGVTNWCQDFTDTYQKSLSFSNYHYYVAVPLDELYAGQYEIRIQFEGRLYRTEKYIIMCSANQPETRSKKTSLESS